MVMLCSPADTRDTASNLRDAEWGRQCTALDRVPWASSENGCHATGDAERWSLGTGCTKSAGWWLTGGLWQICAREMMMIAWDQ